MTMNHCEIFHVRRKGKLRWKWRQTTGDGPVGVSEHEYELFYECLSAARKNGLTPTYPGLRLENPQRPGWVTAAHSPRHVAGRW
jgi:hypothetical protein